MTRGLSHHLVGEAFRLDEYKGYTCPTVEMFDPVCVVPLEMTMVMTVYGEVEL